MNMFEKASYEKYRFASTVGMLGVEDLWDLPLVSTHTRPCLNTLAKALNKRLKASAEESFVLTKEKADTDLETKLEIVKHIIKVKLEALAAAEKAAETRARNQRILEIINNKKDADLAAQSIEDLEKMLID